MPFGNLRQGRGLPEAVGLYLSFHNGFDYAFGADEAKGLPLYDRRTSPTRHNVFALFEELFENAARALHGTTVGYREAGSVVEPVLRAENTPDRRAERAYESRSATLRGGVLDYADAFVRAVRLTGYRFDDIKPTLLARAERCVVHPTREETAHLLDIVHAEDLGSENVMSFHEYRLPGPSILLHPKRFVRLLRTSNWKYGTARSLGIPGFNHLLRFAELTVSRFKRKASASPFPQPHPVDRLLFTLVRNGYFPALNRLRKLMPKK